MKSFPAFAVVVAVLASFSQKAAAFCQAAVCEEGECITDADGCKVGGLPVAWRKGCVSFAVHTEGSEVRGLSANDLELAVMAAAETWQESSCAAFRANIELMSDGQVECGRVEFNQSGRNANIWMFRDRDWPYGSDGHAAFTTLSYDTSTGELLDADVEINTAQINITKDSEEGGFDLRSVVLHEMGHFLGLDHSGASGAVMEPTLEPNTPRRELMSDDEAGICALYAEAPLEVSCEPFGGFSEKCRVDQAEEPPPKEEAPSSESSPSRASSGCHFLAASPPSTSVFFAPWFVLWLLARRRRSLRTFSRDATCPTSPRAGSTP